METVTKGIVENKNNKKVRIVAREKVSFNLKTIPRKTGLYQETRCKLYKDNDFKRVLKIPQEIKLFSRWRRFLFKKIQWYKLYSL